MSEKIVDIELTSPDISVIMDEQAETQEELVKLVEERPQPKVESLPPSLLKQPTGNAIGDRTFSNIFNSVLGRDPTEEDIEAFHYYLDQYKNLFGHNMTSEKLTASWIKSNLVKPEVEVELSPDKVTKRTRKKKEVVSPLPVIDKATIEEDIKKAVEVAKAKREMPKLILASRK